MRLDFGRINGIDAAEQAMTDALDRIPNSKIECEIFCNCGDGGTGVADLIGCEPR